LGTIMIGLVGLFILIIVLGRFSQTREPPSAQAIADAIAQSDMVKAVGEAQKVDESEEVLK